MLRNFSRVLAILAAALLAAAPGLRAQSGPVRGDVDGDGQITLADARLVSDFLVGRAVPAGIDVRGRGDVNADGKITAVDVAIITAAAAGRDVSRFPVRRPLPEGLLAVECRADVRANTVECAPPGTPNGVRGDILLAEQHVNIELASTITSNTGNVFAFNVTVKNLIPQALGVDSTGAADPDGVVVYFNSGPTMLTSNGGAGSILTVQNPDGVGTFSASGQAFYRYSVADLSGDGLATGETSAPKNWQIHYDPGVNTFGFTLYVSAPVQFPAGWVDVYPPYHAPSPTFVGVDTLVVGQTLQLVDSVRTHTGNYVPGAPVSWSSTGHGAASVNTTGLVTAAAEGVDSIIAAAGVRRGRAAIIVTAPNADSTTITAAPTSIAAGDTSVITVQVRDGFGRNVTFGGLDIELTTDVGTLVAGAESGLTVNAVDNGDGTYTAKLTGTAAGTATVTGTLNAAAIGDNATVVITPAGASVIEKTAGDGQTATVGTAVATPPSVTVKDAFGNPVAGVAVTFTVGATSGTVSDGTTTGAAVTINSNGSGVATVASWTLGTDVGVDSLYASATGATTVAFTATATAGPAANMVKSAGDAQTATAGSAVAVNPAVTITDSYGNPVSGVSVTFAVASGGGSVTGGSATTNAAGVATVGSWTLGTTAGANTLDASSTGLTTVTFTATGTAGAPANMVKSAGDAQTAVAGSAVATNPAVTITDANGNPVSGVSVTFAVASGGGSVTGGSATTNAAGVATVGSWTLGTTAGANTLDASSAGLTTVTFTATGVAGPAANMVKSAGDAQTATVNTAVPVNPAVTVTDANGNPVAGVSVTFAVASGGGSVTGGSATTNAAGVATVGSWTLGTTAGANTLNASSTGLTTVTFTATGTPGAPANIIKNAGDGQSATVNTAVPIAPQVLITDAFSNPVPGISVTFAVGSGGGSVTGGSATTNASGLATVGSWTLGTLAGGNTLTATAGALNTTFNATGTPDVPATITKTAGDLQNGSSGAAVAIPPAVNVKDQYGNNVPGVTITFAVTGGGGSVTGGTPTTNASGNAAVGSWTLGSGPTTNTLSASATPAGTSTPVTFTAYIPPLANVDNSQAMGNTKLDSLVAPNALANDVTINGGTIALKPASIGTLTTARLGAVTMSSTGRFTYLPPAGNVLRDSVPYTINDGHFDATGYIKFTFVGKVWYVESGFAGAPDGRSETPFTSVGAAATAALANDTILVRTGSGATTGGTLKNGQLVFGARVGPFTTVLNTQTVTLLAKGTAPTVGGLTLGSGNILRGIRVLNGSGAGLSGTSIGTLQLDSLSVGATGGPALDLANGTVTGFGGGAVALDSLRSTNSATTGLSLSSVGGTFNINGGTASSISGPTGAAVSVAGAAPNITFPGTISKSNAAGSGISLTGLTGGTIAFTGPSVVLSTGSSSGINITGTATVSFVDSVKVTTTSGGGVSASGGGTLTIAGTHNSISSGSGTALNVSGTTIGATGLNFRSISANGAANGIVLINTGSSGGLTVSGNGTAGSGGTIQNTTGADGATAGNGVYLQSTRNVVLKRMQINDHQNHGIRGIGVTAFTLDSSVVSGTNGNSLSGTFNESSIHLDSLSGAVVIRQNTISGGSLDNLYVANNVGSPALNRLQLINNTIGGTINQDGVRLTATVGTFNVTATGNNFTYWEGDAFDMLAQGTATGDLVFQNNTAHNTNATPVSGSTNIAVGGGNFTYNISNNSFRGAAGAAVAVDESGSIAGTVSGTIDNNQIGATGVVNSGSSQGSGIFVQQLGAGTSTTKISNNIIRQINGTQAILVQVSDASAGGGNGTLNATVVGNNIQEEGSLAATRTAINFNIGTVAGDAHTACLQIGGTGAEENFITNFDLNRIRPQHRFNTTVRMPGYGGGPYDTAAVTSYLTPRNDVAGAPTINASSSGTGGGFQNTAGGANCPQPTT